MRRRSLLDLAFAAVLVVGILSAPSTLAAQQVHGHVLEAGSDAALGDVAVRVLRAGSEEPITGVLTDSVGFFRLTLPGTGTYVLRAEGLGYRPVESEPMEIVAGKLLLVTLRMSVDAIAMEPIQVIGESTLQGQRLAEFWDRKRRME